MVGVGVGLCVHPGGRLGTGVTRIVGKPVVGGKLGVGVGRKDGIAVGTGTVGIMDGTKVGVAVVGATVGVAVIGPEPILRTSYSAR